MSATVATAVKKIAVAILTDKKLRKTVLGIVLGIIIIIVMPFAAIIVLFNGDIHIDTDRLQTLVVQNMSAEEKARLQRVEDLMYEIEEKMTDAGLDSQRVKEAQVLYVLALSDFSEEAGFVDKLVGCFSDGQTDASERRISQPPGMSIQAPRIISTLWNGQKMHTQKAGVTFGEPTVRF